MVIHSHSATYSFILSSTHSSITFKTFNWVFVWTFIPFFTCFFSSLLDSLTVFSSTSFFDNFLYLFKTHLFVCSLFSFKWTRPSVWFYSFIFYGLSLCTFRNSLLIVFYIHSLFLFLTSSINFFVQINIYAILSFI